MGLFVRLHSFVRLVFDSLCMLCCLFFAITKALYWDVWQFLNAPHKTLFDQVVAITGGAGALGSAVALKLVREGAKVVLIDRDQVSRF